MDAAWSLWLVVTPSIESGMREGCDEWSIESRMKGRDTTGESKAFHTSLSQHV